MSEQERSFLEATLPHLDAVFRVARSLSGDQASAEDLAQDTYLRAFSHFETHTGQNTKGWLVTICLNLARSHWRRRQRRPEVLVDSFEREPESSQQVPEEAAAELTRRALFEALRALPPEQRTAIVLMDLAGHSASEIAAMTGAPRGTVLARVHRGRRRLAGLLAERGIDSDVL